jgi:hypothetical protein
MKDFLYVLKLFGTLPFWLRALVYILISTIAVAVAGYWGRHAALITGAFCILAALLILGFSKISEWIRKRKTAELKGEGVDFGIPSKIVDTDMLERVSELRRDFDEGLHKFQVFGKDIYELPWYVLIGENGSGKTEAILHSKVELPRDLQNKEQVAGPSPHINWWFTNYGVILDTKGEMVFRGEDSETTPEWMELLSLLKRDRPDCPLNGVILTIGADSLLKDSPKEIDRKSRIVASHLDQIQSQLGVKLPVYVLVTKCDLIDGFLPFFNGIKDSKLQQQMLGWSKPAPLEAPFRPENFEDFMQILVNRLRRMRMDLIRTPIPQDINLRRVDEVDELYCLPESILKIVSPLRSFLEDIFVPREWAASPLFLRGVYFTSACPNDDRSVEDSDKSPEVSWYNQTSYFLREVFLAKIFREDALVTSTGTEQQKNLRNRTLLFIFGVLSLLLIIASALNTLRDLKLHVVPQLGFWDRASIGWDQNNCFSPIVSYHPSPLPSVIYNGNSPIGMGPSNGADFRNFAERFNEPNLSIVSFLEKITLMTGVGFSENFLSFHPVFRYFFNFTNQRYEAQRVLFEGCVLKPLLLEARHKMIRDSSPSPQKLAAVPTLTGQNISTLEAHALMELVVLETSIFQRKQGKLSTGPGITFLPTLLEYTCGETNTPSLNALMSWTYSGNPTAKSRWAPDWMSGGSSLQSNSAINAGIDRLLMNAQHQAEKLDKNLTLIQGLAAAASTYSEAEAKLSASTSVKADPGASDAIVQNAFQTLRSAKVEMEQQINVVRASGLFGNGPETLTSAVTLLKNGDDSYFGAITAIVNAINAVLPEMPQTNMPSALAGVADQLSKVTKGANQVSSSVPSSASVTTPLNNTTTALNGATNTLSLLASFNSHKYQLFTEIRGKLEGVSTMLNTKLASSLNDKLLDNYKALDANLFVLYKGQPAYLSRWNLYEECANSKATSEYNPSMYLVDQRWAQMKQMMDSVNEIYARVDAYSGPFNEQMQTACTYFLQRFKDAQVNLYISNYVKQAKTALLRVARFPLVWPPGTDNQALDFNQLYAAKGLLEAISADLQSSVFTELPASKQKPATDFYSKLAPLYNVVDALILPNGTPARVLVTLFNGQAQTQLSGPNYAPLPTPTPTPTPPPKSMMSKLFFDMGSKPPPPPPDAGVISTMNWNAIELVGNGAGGVYPLDSQTDILLGTFSIQDPFSFQVYHSLMASDGTRMVEGGENWSALRLIARLGGTKIGVGQDWRVSLMPNEPHGVWVRFSFELPLPDLPWPTLDSLGLRSVN